MGHGPMILSLKPSPSQLQALEDIAAHGDPYYRVQGQAQHGGWASVMNVLQNRLWARYSATRRRWVLMAEGRRVLAE